MTAVDMTRELDSCSIAPHTKTISVVVATDGSEAAIAAFQAASLISAKILTEVHVLSVVEPMPVLFPVFEGVAIPPDLDRSREETQRTIVSEQMKPFAGSGDWSVDVLPGRAPESIVEFARDQKASLIIVGLNKHGIVGRVFGEETAIEIAKYSDIPLLVASSGMNRLPRRVIVAMDLNPEGLESAPQALSIVADTPSISCVHVRPRSEFLGIDWAEYDSEYEFAMRERFAEIEKALAKVNLRPDMISLHGAAGHELTDYAAYSKAELIVVGMRRRRGRSRPVSGRMAARILRHAKCSVLIAPNLVPRESLAAGSTEVINDPKLWTEKLRTFTSRNAGRVVSLEVDDPEIGALVEATSYPFLGGDYDHRDDRLTLTFGYTRGVERHLTRMISHPEALSILSIEGRDMALAVQHGGGQTLLTF